MPCRMPVRPSRPWLCWRRPLTEGRGSATDRGPRKAAPCRTKPLTLEAIVGLRSTSSCSGTRFPFPSSPVSSKEHQMSHHRSRGPVLRVSRGKFDPGRFAEVQEMVTATSSYLIPAIRRLPGLISYFVGASPDGSMVNVSVWDSDEHAAPMGALKEMMAH